jgi:chromosome partitioning protein
MEILMAAKIIAVVNQKGGAGKTTVSMQLAGTFGRRGKKVLIIDADPQATATRWAASAEDERPFPAVISGLSAAGDKVHREARKYVDDFDIIIIDCPPAADSPVPQSALMIADIGIVPVIPSPLDLWATVGIGKVITNIRDINEQLQPVILVNQCQLNTSLAKEAMDVLPQFGIPVLKTRLHHRTAYRQSAVFGGTVHDLGPRAAQAIAEVDALTDEIGKLLKAKPQPVSQVS